MFFSTEAEEEDDLIMIEPEAPENTPVPTKRPLEDKEDKVPTKKRRYELDDPDVIQIE